MRKPSPSSPAARRTMISNRRVDTDPEIALRAALHARGLRFRKDYPVQIHGGRATRIDVAFPRARVAVFVDGCFWHACALHGQAPKSNADFWAAKLEANRKRDRLVSSSLGRDGWAVVRAWEHEPLDDVVDRVAVAVAERSARISSAAFP
jgi:DNA mismatch endonuclease (patch repair protein)